jgi:hypothetical protein
MFMRKYVHLAKGLKPQLTKEAADLISEEYTKLRNAEQSENGDNMAKVRALSWTFLTFLMLFKLILCFSRPNRSLPELWRL